MRELGKELPEELLNAIFSTESYSQKGLFKALDCQEAEGLGSKHSEHGGAGMVVTRHTSHHTLHP